MRTERGEPASQWEGMEPETCMERLPERQKQKLITADLQFFFLISRDPHTVIPRSDTLQLVSGGRHRARDLLPSMCRPPAPTHLNQPSE